MTETDIRTKKRLEDIAWAAEKIDRKTLALESELVTTKWFDYRFLSPQACTRLFLETYQTVFRRHFAAEVDRDQAKHVFGAHSLSYRNDPRARTQMWMARQRADELGIPYDLYIQASFEFAVKRNRKRLPQPNQLHHPGSAAELWAKFLDEQFKEHLADGLFTVEHASFRVENYKNLPAQDDYRSFVIRQVKAQSMPPHRAMQRYCCDQRQLPVELFKDVINDEIYEQALTRLEWDNPHFPPPPLPAPHRTDQWPSCLGIPGAQDDSSSPCSECRLADDCTRLSNAILRQVMNRTGSEDPRADDKRAKARERQRRRRSRLNAEKLHAMHKQPEAVEFRAGE
ncbi:hypothetical protein E2A64_15230 [Pseudohoeflea suaedae]|uniref:Uncharacterized protein n=1 Tax=Pseudohoeflea suaedae TaxID=877384 RepID=A0A4R5PIL5_9HYPH|nr:hypothetical protein [Pseudohoeflea suaedae]TDH35065.1 hypothetical protein E2A64_15230 [Pseudohoeflea suaedae]